MITNDSIIDSTGMCIEEVIAKGATDFKFFIETVTNFKLERFHLDWVRSYLNNPRTCITAFRGSTKTTTLGSLFPLWTMFYEDNIFFLTVSPVAARQSMKIVMETRRLIDNSELLENRLKPEDKGYSWTTKHIRTANNCEMNIAPYSTTSKTYHPHYMLFDEAQEFRDLDIYRDTFMPMRNFHQAKVMVIGTPHSEADLLATLNLPGSGFKCLSYPIVDEAGEPLWPKRFPASMIPGIIRDVGEVSYARQYLLKLTSGKMRSISSEAILESLNPEIQLIPHGVEGGQYYMGVDLAISPDGDFSVYTIVEKTKGKQIILRAMEECRGIPPNTQVDRIANLHKRFNPVRGYIDISMVGPSVQQSLLADYGIFLKPYKFEPAKRNSLISNLVSIFGTTDGKTRKVRDCRMVIPRDTTHITTLVMTEKLIKELGGLYLAKTRTGMDTYHTTTRNDDKIISLSLACMAASESRSLGEMYVKKIGRNEVAQVNKVQSVTGVTSVTSVTDEQKEGDDTLSWIV